MTLWLCLAAGCDKNDDASLNENGTTTVRLVFNARNEGLVEGFEQNEGMKTLRVIMIDGSGVVDYNRCATLDKEYTSYTVQIDDVPVGIKHFYVIANEASVGLNEESFSAYAAGTTVTDEGRTALKNLVVSNPSGSRYFPRSAYGITQNGIPITGYKESQIISGTESQTIEIPITHAVVKMTVYATNLSSTDCRLTGISFGTYHPSHTFLFDEEGYESIPKHVTLPDRNTNDTYDGSSDFTDITLNADMNASEKTKVFTYYFFEPKPQNATAYTMAFISSTHAQVQNARQFFSGTSGITRNTEIQLTATIKDSGITFANVTVDDWGETHSSGDMNIGDNDHIGGEY